MIPASDQVRPVKTRGWSRRLQFDKGQIGRLIAKHELKVGQADMLLDQLARLFCPACVMCVFEGAAFRFPTNLLSILKAKVKQHVDRWEGRLSVVVQGNSGQIVIKNEIPKTTIESFLNSTPLINMVIKVDQRSISLINLDLLSQPIAFEILHALSTMLQLFEGDVEGELLGLGTGVPENPAGVSAKYATFDDEGWLKFFCHRPKQHGRIESSASACLSHGTVAQVGREFLHFGLRDGQCESFKTVETFVQKIAERRKLTVANRR